MRLKEINMLADKISKLNKQARYVINGMSIPVTVLDYKHSYGCDRWQITPVGGNGKQWVQVGLKFEK